MYDLRRLRLHGLVDKLEGHRYRLTADGLRFAIFYSKLHDRVVAPLFADRQPQAPPQLQRALATLEHTLDGYFDAAHLHKAA